MSKKKAETMKALQVTISGSYRDAKNEVVDVEPITGLVPLSEEEVAKMHVRGRHAVLWIVNAKDAKGEKVYKKRLDDVRQIFIDNIEVVELEEPFSYIGKDIKEMSYEELQDLALAKDLRRIPRPKEVSGVDLREMRSKAYMDYAAKILGMDDSLKIDPKRPLPVEQRINPDMEGYNFAKLPPIVVDGGTRIDNQKKLTNEDILALEERQTNLTSKPGSNLSLDDLKGIAKEKNIPFHPSIGYDSLYAKIFGEAA